MEQFGKKGDYYQAITPQSHMGLKLITLLMAVHLPKEVAIIHLKGHQRI